MTISSVLDWIFPRRCLACREFSPTELCEACHSRFPFLPFSSHPVAVGRYEGILLEMIGRMKFRKEERIADYLGARLGERLLTVAERPAMILPVPLHRRRLRERGFNPAAVMARRVGRLLQVPVELFSLVRSRPTRPQTVLKTAEQRWKNLEGAMELKRPERISGKKVLLIDDVMTTGATIAACSLALREAGAEEIQVAVAARTL